MSGESPEAEGFGPDEPEQSETDPGGFLGWISPDDRLWRHPSEVGRLRLGRETTPTNRQLAMADRHNRTPAWVFGGIVACTVGALFISGLVMATTGASPGGHRSLTVSTLAASVAPPTTEAGSAHLQSTANEAHALATVRPSLVALVVHRAAGSSTVTGIVAESGGIVVTTMAAVAGATSIDTLKANGAPQPVAMVGKDPTSGIAVLREDTDLPPANFALTDPTPGTVALAVAVADRAPASPPRVSVYAGTVQSSGVAATNVLPVGPSQATVFASTVVKAPLGMRDVGCALVDSRGQVTGVLESTTVRSTGSVAVFLPASLVLGVARQLVTGGIIGRGWMGVDATNNAAPGTSTGGGAVLDSITQGGAAGRAGLQVGDIIVAIDGEAVHSVAELRTRLYPHLPGDSLMVTFDRAGVQRTATVVLTGRPGAQTAASSP